jgi:pyruvate-formate lyase-activating enzyme
VPARAVSSSRHLTYQEVARPAPRRSGAIAEELAEAAERLGCASVAFTYNDPVVFMEYAIDAADACRARGIKRVAVTAGYMCTELRALTGVKKCYARFGR